MDCCHELERENPLNSILKIIIVDNHCKNLKIFHLCITRNRNLISSQILLNNLGLTTMKRAVFLTLAAILFQTLWGKNGSRNFHGI